jgi:tRNA G18 (ribose-2'-O)-methylase SpoU
MRGYFEIGIYHTKKEVNVGTLWRSAYLLGATGIFTIGKRYQRQASDTPNTTLHIPLRQHLAFEEFLVNMPTGAILVGIEMNGKPLKEFSHPERAVYLLGAEDHGLPNAVMERCKQLVSIESVRPQSFNVAVAGSIVMYDRLIKRQQQQGASTV